MSETKENKKKERKCAESIPEEGIVLGMLAKEGKIAVIKVYVTSPPVVAKKGCQLRITERKRTRFEPIYA